MPAAAAPVEAEVDGRRIKLTHLDKVLYEADGFTKAQMLDYYSRISEFMLPHLREHAVTLKRYPHGAGGEFFFEKACPDYRPPWMKTVMRHAESSDRDIDYCVVDDRASLIWLANQSTIEFHVPMALRRSMERPRALVFDLDPGPGVDAAKCAEVALALRELLAVDDLRAWPKSSGSKGIHVYVPLNRPRMTFERTKEYAHAVADRLAEERADVTAQMRKASRGGKVFIDWSQNSTHKTTVCPYSLRARERPTVSAPLAWSEVEAAAGGAGTDALLHTTDDVLERVAASGDLFAAVLSTEQSLPRR
ncbi:MAG: non-homologous end-joining DNA ligase [Solirubrobacterales bacterium]